MRHPSGAAGPAAWRSSRSDTRDARFCRGHGTDDGDGHAADTRTGVRLTEKPCIGPIVRVMRPRWPQPVGMERTPLRVKHVIVQHMKTVTVRDLRQRWPETEQALQTEGEILVTRDSTPVARLVRYVAPDKPRTRFDPVAQGKWQRKMSGGKVTRWVDEGLLTERDER